VFGFDFEREKPHKFQIPCAMLFISGIAPKNPSLPSLPSLKHDFPPKRVENMVFRGSEVTDFPRQKSVTSERDLKQ
jgi:hypothetical protein